MQTIQLKVSDKVYDRFMLLLSKFSKDEIQVIDSNQEFLTNKKYLQQELKEVCEDKATFYSQDEFEDRLNDIV